MYSTCIFCNRPLGANEILEDFPVGRRIAFDSGQGRLWVVCRGCERWNLSPLDQRWEIIEQCERQFRDTRLRVSTENIGLARLSEGLELVRVGQPLRPELAAWRYGDQFGRRRQKRIMTVGFGLAGVGALLAGAGVAGIAVGSMAGIWSQGIVRIISGDPDAIVARLRTGERMIPIKRKHLARIDIFNTAREWVLIVPDGQHTIGLSGAEAEEAIAKLMPPMNRFGATGATVRDAVRLLEQAGQPQAYFEQVADSATRRNEMKLNKQPYAVRLALEMAAHEDAERRALEGELRALELAWKEAEEIAAISDSLFTPAAILEKIARWRERGATP